MMVFLNAEKFELKVLVTGDNFLPRKSTVAKILQLVCSSLSIWFGYVIMVFPIRISGKIVRILFLHDFFYVSKDTT